VNLYFRTLNAFIEDTCVLTVVAYLLARGGMLDLLFQPRLLRRQALYLGLILGLIGLTETIFPGARYPYVTSTLIVTFASVTGGLQTGLAATCVIVGGSILLQPANAVMVGAITGISASIGALLGAIPGRLSGTRITPVQGLALGAVAQAAVVLFRYLFAHLLHVEFGVEHALVGIPANGFGLLLLLLVVRDARMHADSVRHREEVERAQALIAEAQLRALRARIRPHFLFNALTSIAALCSIAPDRAEEAIGRLSQQMRRALSSDPAAPLQLCEEIQQVRAYLEIEQLRLGDRLQVRWDIDPTCTALPVPAFSLQTLVENAVSHGIAPKLGQGVVKIVAHRADDYTLIVVSDSGVGLPTQHRSDLTEAAGAREHGLQILAQQLTLLHGRKARLRLLSRPDHGVIAAFALPRRDDMGREMVDLGREMVWKEYGDR
jgi:signal transduction histidine kinase